MGISLTTLMSNTKSHVLSDALFPVSFVFVVGNLVADNFVSVLNQLIMDYLVSEGYKTAAEEFSKEADVPSPTDFESIESRMNIREAVQRGNVEEAIERTNELDPEVGFFYIFAFLCPSFVRRRIKLFHAPLSDLQVRDDLNTPFYYYDFSRDTYLSNTNADKLYRF